MRFLIDECLHTSLVEVAHEAGFVAVHVNYLGMGGVKDWQLIETILLEEYTFGTNNRADFVLVYSLAAAQKAFGGQGGGNSSGWIR